MRLRPFREVARVQFHLNGFTRIVLERFENSGIAGGGEQEIPTEMIPTRLRAIGSRFVISGQYIRAEAGDTAEQLREALKAHAVESVEPGEPFVVGE